MEWRLIFDAIFAIPEIFVKIMYMSFRSGVFPSDWKITSIAVIPKKGVTKYLDNLRPISILSVLEMV